LQPPKKNILALLALAAPAHAYALLKLSRMRPRLISAVRSSLPAANLSLYPPAILFFLPRISGNFASFINISVSSKFFEISNSIMFFFIMTAPG
jgi:hypothetical protein